ncbi:hypothetical protein [Helicobacter sp. MIT 14-3879]|uniref:hypothetical protein n=1 Tax=Helicobacter sp. MIT 14-3879 TaxID=2040649 RepID=UPI0011C03906|nr:hypothetical protein [Helicobacter sp. MIT 14-3879]
MAESCFHVANGAMLYSNLNCKSLFEKIIFYDTKQQRILSPHFHIQSKLKQAQNLIKLLHRSVCLECKNPID